MSYIKVPDSDQKQEDFKHRNPIYPSLKYPQPRPVHTLQSQITSSLLLQQLLYFNWYYTIILFYNLYFVSQVQRFIYFKMEFGVPIRVIVAAITLILQIFRLQNGIYGNLKESFPQICAFLMLTLITAAGQLFLIVGFLPYSPLEWSLLFYSLFFQLLQLIVCIFVMGKLTRTQKALFIWRSPVTSKK